nr:synaptotagmin-4-like [Anser cygnoides]
MSEWLVGRIREEGQGEHIRSFRDSNPTETASELRAGLWTPGGRLLFPVRKLQHRRPHPQHRGQNPQVRGQHPLHSGQHPQHRGQRTPPTWLRSRPAASTSKSSGRGELLISLCYQSITNTLTVVVLKARHLPKSDVSGLSDPYVKVNLYHGKKRISKKKTHVKKCTPNAVFNELFVFDIPCEGLDDISIEFLVLDSDRGSRKEVIGRLTLGYSAEGTGGEHWKEICEYPRRQIAKWHMLCDG